MTSPLDDALDSSSPVFHPAEFTIDWREMDPQEGSTNLDSPRVLSDQMGDYTVTHSLDDALPDPVTMTSGNDASGSAEVALLGREGIQASTVAWRTNRPSGTGSTGVIPVTLPTDASWDDYVLIVVLINSAASVEPDETELTDPYPWTLLGTQDDGSGLKSWIWGATWHAEIAPPTLFVIGSGNWSWASVALTAHAANPDYRVRIRPGTVVSQAETVSGTTHTSPAYASKKRMVAVGVFGTVAASASWTPTGGSTELVEAAATVDLMLSSTTTLDPGNYAGLTATTTAATGLAVMAAVPLEIMDRDRMSGRKLFSPFNDDSPFYGMSRDLGKTSLMFGVVTDEGVVNTNIHQGQLAAIDIQGQDVKARAISSARINMQSNVVFPKTWGARFNVSLDWMACFIMARAGHFPGPAPTKWANYWNPFYGGNRGMLEGVGGVGYVRRITVDAPYPGTATPNWDIPGPYFLGRFFQQIEGVTHEASIEFKPSDTPLPHQLEQNPNWRLGGMFTKTESAGRISFWVKGDPISTVIPQGHQSFMVDWQFSRENSSNVDIGSVWFRITELGRVAIWFDGQGFTFVSAGTVPQDGEWHFVSFRWNYLTRQASTNIDGFVYNASPANWTAVDVSDLPVSNEAGTAAGGKVQNFFRPHLPVADMQVELGIEPFDDVFAEVWPPALTPNSFSAVMKPSGVQLQALFDSAPFPGWETFADVARNALSWYRANESDAMELLALEYFGTGDLMVPQSVADTEVNAGDLDLYQDPTKIRNVVTVRYKEVRVDTAGSRVYELSEAIELPRGYTEIVFPLDIPIVEIWSEGNPGPVSLAGNFTLENMSAGHANGSIVLPPFRHFFFVNTAADGSGTYLAYNTVQGRILRGDATTITVGFTNQSVSKVYIVNNGNEIPFLVLKGLAVHTTDAYYTLRDEVAIKKRGERPIEVELNWIQSRAEAQRYANRLMTVVSTPRPELSVNVMGDPRRTPGQLFTVEDSEGTLVQGTWRAISVSHEAGGPKYIQTMRMVRVNPVAVWDESPGWDESVWGE